MREPILHIATQAVRQAGNLILRALERKDHIQKNEKKPNDWVTNIDQQVERELITIIRKTYPTHSILAEESGALAGDEVTWVIDPIDGTRNFMHGFPHFAISVGVKFKDKMRYGIIYDPVRQELFTAAKGKGAFLNEKRIRVSEQKKAEHALIATGFAFRHAPIEEQTAPASILQKFIEQNSDFRRGGCASLDLAYVACGRLDGFWEFGLKPWDYAAGALIVSEAGGLVCNPFGEENIESGNIVAASPAILKSILKIMHPCLKR